MENAARESYNLYINGQWVDASDGGTFKSYCPANGEYLSTCAEATREDVDAAVDAAWAAWESWKKTTPAERADALLKIADVIDQNKERLALLETLDNGKPIRETMTYASDHFRYFAGAVRTEEGEAAMLDENTLSLILREPIGVVGQIVPWNFPFLMAAWKLAPVLAAGCCTVFKPSSYTSLSVLELAKLIDGILPPGVFNIVLELGGKSANIFFPDCKWDMAMDGLQLGILFNQGQVCCAGSRVFVHEDIYDRFVEEAVAKFNSVKVGLPWEADTMMGSQIYEAHLNKILDYIEIGKKEGARVACGGERITDGELAKGCFLKPTLLVDVTNDMRVAQEEIFGPVAVVMKFKDEEDVIRMANESEYGLGGAVWTRDINRAVRVCRAIETGRMWVNTYNAIPAGAPFGGYKKSGIGRETHKVILEHYTQMKNIMINLSENPSGFY